jgi:hypothetical protein
MTPTVLDLLPLPYQADSTVLRDTLTAINALEWEQVTIASATSPRVPLVQVPRNKLIITLVQKDFDFDLVLSEW